MKGNSEKVKNIKSSVENTSESPLLSTVLSGSLSPKTKRKRLLRWAVSSPKIPASFKTTLKSWTKTIVLNLSFLAFSFLVGIFIRLLLDFKKKNDISLHHKNESEFGLTDALSIVLLLVLLNWSTSPTPTKKSIKASCADKAVRHRMLLRNAAPLLFAGIAIPLVKFFGLMSGKGYIQRGVNGNRIFELSDIVSLLCVLFIFRVADHLLRCRWEAGFSDEANTNHTAITCCLPKGNYLFNFGTPSIHRDIPASGETSINVKDSMDSMDAQENADLPILDGGYGSS